MSIPSEKSAPPLLRDIAVEADFVVVGGGLAGVCAALAAARHGATVALVQDRPVLGGNASSEMRMGIMGAHGDCNKEAGILEELQLRNFYYNPLLRYTLWDDVLLSTVRSEPNITLLLNTSVCDVEMEGGTAGGPPHDGRLSAGQPGGAACAPVVQTTGISAVLAWNSNSQTRYRISGRLFADCSGDGILRLSGAEFRHGREDPAEFGETYLQQGGDRKTMGNSILLQLRRTDEHHPFRAPPGAYHFTDADFERPSDEPPPPPGTHRVNYLRLYPEENNFWWIEYGGNLDTIGDANAIQEELKKIAWGVWEYIKNHPDGRGRGYELDWIGALPGKRESTRFIGPHILTQGDVLAGGHFDDVVAYGGWTLDDHHPDAFFKKGRISVEYGCPSPFGIPWRCLYSRNVPNLVFAGRDISCSHMGLSDTRVMGTCAALGQAVGTAAALCLEHGCTPAELAAHDGRLSAGQSLIATLQATLEDDDCMLPYRWRKPSAITREAHCAPECEVLRSGIDRDTPDGAENGMSLPCAHPDAQALPCATYEWPGPRRLSGARLVFDSQMTFTGKRMCKLEATAERAEMPAPLARAFRIDARVGGAWRTVFSDPENFLRLRQIAFAEPVEADAIRLVVESAWGGGPARVFAFDAL
ncbi:MAG: FAD-dependent oxidoreductase [Kiritimatiellae bacterium]|nr:FAD-dependent oxidoreductase [Kiritimatiellia bacterium]